MPPVAHPPPDDPTPTDLRVISTIVGPDSETCPIDTVEITVDLDQEAEALLSRIAATPENRTDLLAYAIAVAARLHSLDRWRRTTPLGIPGQRRLLERAFDVTLSTESRGRFVGFHRGQEERAGQWAANARARGLARAWDTVIPQMETFNARAAARLARLREMQADR